MGILNEINANVKKQDTVSDKLKKEINGKISEIDSYFEKTFNKREEKLVQNRYTLPKLYNQLDEYKKELTEYIEKMKKGNIEHEKLCERYKISIKEPIFKVEMNRVENKLKRIENAMTRLEKKLDKIYKK